MGKVYDKCFRENGLEDSCYQDGKKSRNKMDSIQETKEKFEDNYNLDIFNKHLGDNLILTLIKTKSKYSKKWKIQIRKEGKKKLFNIGYITIKNTRPKKTVLVEPIELGILKIFYFDTFLMVCLVASMKVVNNGKYKKIDGKKYKLDFGI